MTTSGSSTCLGILTTLWNPLTITTTSLNLVTRKMKKSCFLATITPPSVSCCPCFYLGISQPPIFTIECTHSIWSYLRKPGIDIMLASFLEGFYMWLRNFRRMLVGYFAPVIAAFRAVKKRSWNYPRQLRAIYRYVFWRGKK